MQDDTWKIGGKTLSSRLLIGSALYPSPANMEDAIKVSQSQIVTVALRRQSTGDDKSSDFCSIQRRMPMRSFRQQAGRANAI
jgi:thiazole synthase